MYTKSKMQGRLGYLVSMKVIWSYFFLMQSARVVLFLCTNHVMYMHPRHSLDALIILFSYADDIFSFSHMLFSKNKLVHTSNLIFFMQAYRCFYTKCRWFVNLSNLSFSMQSARWNIRCAPEHVADMVHLLKEPQKDAFLHANRLSNLLDIKLRGSGPPSLLTWLYDKIDPETMILKVGPGKEIKLTKELVHTIIGVPNEGGSVADNASYNARVQEAKALRADLGVPAGADFKIDYCLARIRRGGTDDLTKRCFFLVLFNRLFFSTASNNINNSDIGKTMDMRNFDDIDWCHAIYQHLCMWVKLYHDKIDQPQAAYTLGGCSTVLLVPS